MMSLFCRWERRACLIFIDSARDSWQLGACLAKDGREEQRLQRTRHVIANDKCP